MLDSLTLTAPRPQPQPSGRAASAMEPACYALGSGGHFVLRRRERLLLVDGEPAELGSRAVEVLLALIEGDGALLTKSALLDRAWPGVVVEENNLQVQVSALRRALGPEGRGWIATVPGRGYRFTGPVAALPDGEEAAVASRPTAMAAAAPPLSVVVLPFAGHGEDPAGDWFADGLTDSLTTDLARALPLGSTVIAQATADLYRGQPADVRAIGREQGVRFVVEGSVLLAEKQVRVNVQLVATDTGAHVWADRFDTSRQDNVLRIQDEIVGRLARAVGLRMIDAAARWAERERPEEEGWAQDYVLRARAAVTRRMVTRGDVETACALLRAGARARP